MFPPAEEILKRIDELPESAVVSVRVAAMHDGVSERTIRRTYPLVHMTERRRGVRVSYLRHRRALYDHAGERMNL